MRLERKHRWGWRGALAIAILLALVSLLTYGWRASSRRANSFRLLGANRPEVSPGTIDADTESGIAAFCGDCHALPHPDSFPRDAWYDGVRKGYEFYARSGRSDLNPPSIHQVVAYYRSRAPEELSFPVPEEAATQLRATFRRERIAWNLGAGITPAVSHLLWTPLQPGNDSMLLACDMRHGGVFAVNLRDPAANPRLLARLDNPCHMTTCDLDGDGALDLLVAVLGSFFPAEHDRGRVVWLRPQANGAAYESLEVVTGLGRVADVRAADVDRDGDLDLIVAEFGQYLTGSIVLFRNVSEGGERPRFQPEKLDPRPGTIHVPVCDFDRDGDPDFLALISQEHESLTSFINQGNGRFRPVTLWAGPDLAFGSSGIEIVDLDQDGDMDILYTNGDAFDNSYVNPSHGVQWLENVGEWRFVYHRLTSLIGAYRALAGDIDLDGDLDIIVVSFLPPQLKNRGLDVASLPSVICLEQTSRGQFARHTLARGECYYATFELADFDDDGDLDFAAGVNVVDRQITDVRKLSQGLSIWWNEKISAKKRSP